MRKVNSRSCRPICRREALYLAALTGFASGLAPHAAHSAAPAGAVDALQGEAFAIAANARRSLAFAAEIFVGDLVGTQPRSTMRLKLGTTTEVHLGPEARLKVDRFVQNAGGVLLLEAGGLMVNHPRDPASAGLAVRSSFGLIAIRGTRFFAGPSNGVFGVFTEEGEVMVVAADTTVVVAAGQGTNIARPGAAPSDPAPWGEARIRAARQLVGAN